MGRGVSEAYIYSAGAGGWQTDFVEVRDFGTDVGEVSSGGQEVAERGERSEGHADGGFRANTEEVTALPVVTDPAVISETKEETMLPKENEGEKVRARIARVPTYEIIVVKKRRGAYQGNQVGAAGIPGGNQGLEATSGADTLVAMEPVGVANNRRVFEEAGHGMAANGGISCGKLEKTSKGGDNQAGE